MIVDRKFLVVEKFIENSISRFIGFPISNKFMEYLGQHLATLEWSRLFEFYYYVLPQA
jgi:hypothetical protein